MLLILLIWIHMLMLMLLMMMMMMMLMLMMMIVWTRQQNRMTRLMFQKRLRGPPRPTHKPLDILKLFQTRPNLPILHNLRQRIKTQHRIPMHIPRLPQKVPGHLVRRFKDPDHGVGVGVPEPDVGKSTGFPFPSEKVRGSPFPGAGFGARGTSTFRAELVLESASDADAFKLEGPAFEFLETLLEHLASVRGGEIHFGESGGGEGAGGWGETTETEMGLADVAFYAVFGLRWCR
jgi:hypothetical protein